MEAQFHEIISGRDRRVAARLARPALSAVAAGYRFVIGVRNGLYHSGILRIHRAEVPVVSIGNITLGGTGKTPFVEFVCRWFLERSQYPAILSRGYGSDRGHNDEALVLRANLPAVPHWQGKDRVQLAARICHSIGLEPRPNVLVLDDGFQHRRLARDLDIVLIDCTNPFGFGRIFPRGLLREPIANLRRADLIVLSRSDHVTGEVRSQICDRIVKVAGSKSFIAAEHRPTSLKSHSGETAPAHTLAERSVAAFCGLGNPQAFRKTLDRIGCRVLAMRHFPDHHRYTADDIAELDVWAARYRPDFIVTTQKDLVKIPRVGFGSRPLVSLAIDLAIDDPDSLLDRALSRVVPGGSPSIRPPSRERAAGAIEPDNGSHTGRGHAA